MLHRENVSNNHRLQRIIRDLVDSLSLDLDGLTVYTEAATGTYLYTPILAAVSGAEKVFAITDDSSFASKESVKEQTQRAASDWNVSERIEVIYEKRPSDIAQSDIITNTGFVRPIDRQMVQWMKPTAVVPLMWEPWELRSQVDLEACVEENILVMGTDEAREPTNMYPYAGFLALKLLFELDLEGYRTNVVLLGSGEGLAQSIVETFDSVGIQTTWFSDYEVEAHPYSDVANHIKSREEPLDAILLAELHEDARILGKGGYLDFDTIVTHTPSASIGVIAGNVDVDGLRESGLNYYPQTIQDPGQMSYQAYHLGPRGPLELYAAGLKVGEAMARRRKAGQAPRTVERAVPNEAPALPIDTVSYE